MNVIWWFDSIGLWFHHHRIISWRKRRERESLDKRKDDEKNRMLCHWCFGSPRMHSCVKHEKQVSVWIRREWWWKSGRQGEKSGRKRGGKKGKKGKSGFGKSLFCFCLTVSLPLPFFPQHPPHHHTTPHTHTHPPHHTTWRIGAHHHMQTGPCAVLPFLGVDSETHCIIHTPHSITWHHATHTNQPNTDTAHDAINNK